MNGAASGLIDAFKAALPGTDWDLIPSGGTSWFKYGGGGISGWGTLCGVPNGCCAVLNLVNLAALSDKVLFEYSQSEFPPKGLYDASAGWDLGVANIRPLPDSDVPAYVVPDSPLCHVSISKWCYAAEVDLNDTTPEGIIYKNDRCGKICAYMAYFTATLINGDNPLYSVSDATANCQTCHHADSYPIPAQHGKMECYMCHQMPSSHYKTGGGKH